MSILYSSQICFVFARSLASVLQNHVLSDSITVLQLKCVDNDEDPESCGGATLIIRVVQ